MKFVKLLTAAHVAGVLRHPHEGVLTVTDEDAQRLVDEEKIGEDVSSDFAGEDTSSLTEENAREASGQTGGEPLPNPHQSEVETDDPPHADAAPAAEDETPKPRRRKAAGEQE